MRTSDKPVWEAIAAMAGNRVIGAGNTLPWRLPGDFKFFKRTTMGGILVMGRRTFESIGKALPGRLTVVLSRTGLPGGAPEGVLVLPGLDALSAALDDGTIARAGAQVLPPNNGAFRVFIAGGASLYEQALPMCSGLFLTHVNGYPAGDVFFPPYEHLFDAGSVLETCPEYTIRHHDRL